MFTNKNIIQLIKIIKGELVDLTGDQQDFVKSSRQHRVTSFIYHALLAYPSPPINLLNQFKNEYQHNICRALYQLNCLSKLKKLFVLYNIPMLCVKGINSVSTTLW